LGDATIRRALEAATGRLEEAGCATPRIDAEVLLAHVIGADRARLVIDAGTSLGEPDAERFEAAIARRVTREPVAYITGSRAFRRLDLVVDARVLIPRPETELLVEVGLGLPRGARVIDVCTGSGAVALALADERPDLEVHASDRSSDALAVARANAERLGLAVTFHEADLLDGVDGPWDAILANPPYVADADLDGLDPEVAAHEPRVALTAGENGLSVLRRLIPQAAGVAEVVAVEIGLGQLDPVRKLMLGAGLTDVDARADLAGIDRVVIGRHA
jgi:release factor glutamine methyltransferase